MLFLIILLSLFTFIRTISYGRYELKQNTNPIGGFVIIILALFSLILPSLFWILF